MVGFVTGRVKNSALLRHAGLTESYDTGFAVSMQNATDYPPKGKHFHFVCVFERTG